MHNYLLIESRDSFGQPDGGFCAELAHTLAAAGHGVSVLLVQNGVLPARAGAHATGIAALLAAGVPVLADEFSLAERGIAAQQLAGGVRSTPLSIVIDRMVEGCKVLWH